MRCFDPQWLEEQAGTIMEKRHALEPRVSNESNTFHNERK
jgi:hypothetical protein